jgi:hypothetical protein
MHMSTLRNLHPCVGGYGSSGGASMGMRMCTPSARNVTEGDLQLRVIDPARNAEALDTLRRLRAAELSMTLEDFHASVLASFIHPKDATEMNAVLARLWPDAHPDAKL